MILLSNMQPIQTVVEGGLNLIQQHFSCHINNHADRASEHELKVEERDQRESEKYSCV